MNHRTTLLIASARLRLALLIACLAALLPRAARGEAASLPSAPTSDGPNRSTAGAGPVQCANLEQLCAPPEPAPRNDQSLGFLSRFLDAYIDGHANEPSPTRRSLPDALASPPFPDPSWSLNGTPRIGEPDAAVYPFMRAVYGSGAIGKAIEDSRVKFLGWIDTSWNVSSSSAYQGNFPAAYQTNPNTVTLQQLVLRLKREPDTVQTDHFDIGFNVDFLYGQDYRWTTMNGIFSNQLRSNNLYGYDLNQFYVDLYIPRVGEGLDIRLGRFISIPDIEANLTVDQPFSSHSYTYTYDPFSQMGIVANLKLNRHWWLQAGVVAGDDVALWAKGAVPTFTGCVRWESDDQRDSIYPCINSLNDGLYRTWSDGPTPASSPLAMPANNLQAPVIVWGHRFTKEWTMQTEFWFMWQRNAPAFSNGIPTGRTVRFNYEWTILNFQFWQFSPMDFIGWRNEIMRDVYGQRTGYNTRLWESTVSWNHWFANGFIGLRPEIRFDRALDNGQTPFNGGTKSAQIWGQMDLVIRF